MTTSVLTTGEAVIEFFSRRPEIQTEVVRLLLVRAFTQYLERTKRDIMILRDAAQTIGIPDIEVLCKYESSPLSLADSDIALHEFMVQMRAYLDRRYVVEKRGIRKGQSGTSTNIDKLAVEATVASVQPDYHLLVILKDGTERQIGPGQFVSHTQRLEGKTQPRKTRKETSPTGSGPLEHARALALNRHCSLQDSAILFREIIIETKDEKDLAHLVNIWNKSRHANESMYSNIGERLLEAYLVCGKVSEAVDLIPMIPDESSLFRSLSLLFVYTQDRSYLDQARTRARASSVPKGQSLAVIAQASQHPSDYREARAALETAAREKIMCGSDPDSIQLAKVGLFVKFGDYQQARDTIRLMQNRAPRIRGISFLATASRLDRDLQTMYPDLQRQSAITARMLPDVASAFIACREFDVLRRFVSSRNRLHGHVLERCYFHARLALEEEGVEADLLVCEEAYKHPAFRERIDPSLRSIAAGQYASVLAYRSTLEGALRVVKDIQMPLTKGRTLVAIHRLLNKRREG
jgi:hypothetical protein